MKMQGRISILGPKQELISIALPFVVFAILLVQSLLGISYAPGPENPYFYLPVILASGHTLTTYMFLAMVPEGRKVTSALLKSSWLAPAFLTALIAFLTVYFLVDHYFDPSSHFAWTLAKAFVLLLYGQHSLGQIRGMSMLYNFNLNRLALSPAERERVHQLGRWETRLLYAIVAIWVALFFDQGFFTGSLSVPLTVVMTIFITFTVLVSMLYPYSARSNKTAFLLRLYLFPLALVMPMAVFALVVLHAVEYNQIMVHMFGRSSRGSSWLAWGVFFAGMAVISPLLHNSNLWQAFVSPGFVSAAVVFSQVLDHSHYFVDSVIFRMRYPRIRENLAPLLW